MTPRSTLTAALAALLVAGAAPALAQVCLLYTSGRPPAGPARAVQQVPVAAAGAVALVEEKLRTPASGVADGNG